MSTSLLALLLHKHEEERNQVQRVLAAAQARLDAANAQRQELLGYRRDCELRWQQRFCQGAPCELLQAYLGFMQRLKDALEQQDYSITQMQTLREQSCKSLIASETRVASVRKLLGIRALRQRQLEQRQDRRSHDEVAQQVHRRRALQEEEASLLQTH